jgi:hypothetical protein
LLTQVHVDWLLKSHDANSVVLVNNSGLVLDFVRRGWLQDPSGPVVVRRSLLHKWLTGFVAWDILGSLGARVASHFELFSLYASFP